MNLGLRFDADVQWIPEQHSGPGPFSPLQTWPEMKDVANWKDVSPRLGGAFDVFGNGKTAIKASVSRYVIRDAVAFSVSNNPLLLSASASRSWTDRNGDFEPQEGELGPRSNRNTCAPS